MFNGAVAWVHGTSCVSLGTQLKLDKRMLNTLIKKDVGLAQQNGFGPAFYAGLVEPGKRYIEAITPAKEECKQT